VRFEQGKRRTTLLVASTAGSDRRCARRKRPGLRFRVGNNSYCVKSLFRSGSRTRSGYGAPIVSLSSAGSHILCVAG